MKRYDPSAPLLSLHVPKCGGNSVLMLLQTMFGERLLQHYREDRTNTPPPRQSAVPGGCIHGHFDRSLGEGTDDYYPTVDQFIAFLRDPFEMQVSCYFFLKGLERRNAHFREGRAVTMPERNVGEFIERRIADPTLDPNLLDFLPPGCGADGWESTFEDSFVHLGVTEELNASGVVLAHRLGMPPRWVGQANASRHDEQVPAGLREAFERSHPLHYAIYDYAVRASRDPAAFERPIVGSASPVSEELEFRCRLCADYGECSGRGRPMACDGGSAFRAQRDPQAGAVEHWLETALELGAAADATLPTALDLFARGLASAHGDREVEVPFWIGPSLSWSAGAASVFQLSFGWPQRPLDGALLADLRRICAPLGEPEVERLVREVEAMAVIGLRRVLFAYGGGPSIELLIGLDAQATAAQTELLQRLAVTDAVAALAADDRRARLLRLGADGLASTVARLHVSVPAGRALAHEPALLRDLRQQSERPLRDLGELYAVEAGAPASEATAEAIELSLVRNAVDWDVIAPLLAARSEATVPLSAYNQLKAHFHAVEGALRLSCAEPSEMSLDYRILRAGRRAGGAEGRARMT